MKNWMTPTASEEAARSALREESGGRGQRLLGACILLPAAALLALAVLTICREAWALHRVYTPLIFLFVLALTLGARALGEQSWTLWALALGALGLRVLFALGWTVYPHGDALTGWNLALELAAAPVGQWPSLTAALGAGIPLDLPFVLYEAVLIRLFGPHLASVQLPGALWGGLACVLTARLGQKLSGSRSAGLLAGLFLACCPTLLFSAGVLTVQPLRTLLLLTGLWLLLCRPLGRPLWNEGLAGLAWGLEWVLRPGLPVPLLGLALWLLVTLPGRRREEQLWPRTACLLGAFLAALLVFGGLLSALSGENILDAHLPARAAIGLNADAAGQLTEADRPLLTGEAAAGEALAARWKGPGDTLRLLLRKIRFQFGSYNYEAPRADRGAAFRSFLANQAMHPLLQGYVLALLVLALAGVFLQGKSRGGLLPAAALLGALVPAALLETDPLYNGAVLPLFALWAAMPGLRLAGWVDRLARVKNSAPLPPALAAVRLVVSVVVYALMLGMVLIFFSGEGAFIYEAF